MANTLSSAHVFKVVTHDSLLFFSFLLFSSLPLRPWRRDQVNSLRHSPHKHRHRHRQVNVETVIYFSFFRQTRLSVRQEHTTSGETREKTLHCSVTVDMHAVQWCEWEEKKIHWGERALFAHHKDTTHSAKHSMQVNWLIHLGGWCKLGWRPEQYWRRTDRDSLCIRSLRRNLRSLRSRSKWCRRWWGDCTAHGTLGMKERRNVNSRDSCEITWGDLPA